MRCQDQTLRLTTTRLQQPRIDDAEPIFVELKSRAGVASKTQKQVRVELVLAGAVWWLALSADAGLMALHLSGVVFPGRRRGSSPGRDRSRI